MSGKVLFTTKWKISVLLTLLLAVVIAGCVSIPPQTQLIQQDCGQHETQTLAASDNSRAMLGRPLFSCPTTQLNSETISVLNWNLYKGQQKNWDKDLLRLSAGKDLVLLQEASLNKTLREILSSQSLCWWLNNAFIYKGVETGVMMASKAPPLDSFGLRHLEPLIRVPKTILINRYPLSGTSNTLLVANIHGINFTLGTTSYQKQLDEMRKILSKHNGPLLVAGDFNNWSSQRTKVMNEMADALSLTKLQYDPANQAIRFGQSIDHIFYRGLEPLSSSALQVTSSDHNPLTAQFRVAEKKEAEL